MRLLRDTLTTWFGSGLAPVASGTVGTLAAFPLVWLLSEFAPWPIHLAVGVGLLFAGIWAAADAETRWRRKDPGQVVIDEVAAYVMLTALLPGTPLSWCASFLAFRLFDVTKPWPARRLERLHGALGIMLDDVAAAGYALVTVLVGRWALQAVS